MNYRKFIQMSVCGMMAVSMCSSAISPVFAAENDAVEEAESKGAENNAVEAAENAEAENQNTEAAKNAEADTELSSAEESKETEESNTPEEESKETVLEAIGHPNLENSFKPIILAQKSESDKKFEIPEDCKTSRTHGKLKWYISRQGELHLEDGDLILDDKNGFHPFTMNSTNIKNIVVENVHGTGKVNIIGNAKGLFEGIKMKSFDASQFDTSKCTSMEDMFDNCSQLRSLDLSSWDTSMVTNLSGMFFNCRNLETVNLSSFNTSNVTNMSYMFYGCSNLTDLNVSNFDDSQVTEMSQMFSGCGKLTDLEVTNLTAQNTTDVSGMFKGCSSLKSLNLSSFQTKQIESMDEMFSGCESLETLDLTGWDTSSLSKHSKVFAKTKCMKQIRFQKSFMNSDTFNSDFFPSGTLCFEGGRKFFSSEDMGSQVKTYLLEKDDLEDNDEIYADIVMDESVLPQITFDPNGGEGEPMSYRIYPNDKYLPRNSFGSSENRVFLGWNTKANGTGDFYQNRSEISEDLKDATLYAQWGIVKLYATSLRLGATLGTNFFFEVNEAIAADPTAKVMIKYQGEDKVTSVPLSSAAKNTTSAPGKTLYKVVELLSPERFTDTMEVWVQTDTSEFTHTKYSVKDYAKRVLTDPENEYSPVMKKLMSSVVIYGSRAQIYNDYKTDTLASTGLPVKREVERFIENTDNSILGWIRPADYSTDEISLMRVESVFNPRVVFKLYFHSTYSEKEMKNVKVSWKGKSLKITRTAEDDKLYYATVENLEGLEADRPFYLDITDGNKADDANTIQVPCSLLSGLFYSEKNGSVDNWGLLLKSFNAYTHYLAEYLESRS